MVSSRLFEALVETEWLQRQVYGLLAREEAVLLVLVAVEAGYEALWRGKSVWPVLSKKELLKIAGVSGRWRVVRELQPQCKPMRYRFSVNMSMTSGLGPLTDRALAQCLWMQRHHPVEFSSSWMYAAIRRGCLEEVKWLHVYRGYDTGLALETAAKGRHLDVVVWLLDHQARDVPLHPRYHVVLRRADSFLDGIAWIDTETSMAHCALSSHGFLPPVPHFQLYPLMDWAADHGDLRLLRRLHCDSKLINTCSYRAMRSAAARGDMEMVEWLHQHRTEHLGDMAEVILLATTHGHVALLGWFRVHRLIPSSLPRVIEETARAGQTEVLRWLYTYRGEFADRSHQLSYLSVQSGRLDMAQYVCEELGYGVTLTVLLSAALRGHVDICALDTRI